MANMKDYSVLVGETINDKILLKYIGRGKGYHPIFKFKCKCGREHETTLNSIKSSNKCSSCCQSVPKPYKRLRLYESTFNAFIHRVKYEVNITYEDFYEIIKSQKCHYCEADLCMDAYRNKTKRSTAACLDRKDNSIGYMVDNIVPCCPKCNYGKGKWYTYEEWVEVGKTLNRIYTNKQKLLEAQDDV